MAFWKNDDSFAPFNVPQVGPTIPAMPTPDAKDAEIAKLRADLDQARRDRNSAVECAEVLRGYVAEHKAALAAARAALDGYKSPEAAHNLAMRAIEESHRANRAEAALKDCRAALDGEREACDAWASLFDLNIGAFIYKDEGTSFRQLWSNDESVRIARKHRDRRAAEAKASRGGEGKPCPDCKGSGVRVRYHGGSLTDSNVIGLAMESAPCWCQAAAREPKP